MWEGRGLLWGGEVFDKLRMDNGQWILNKLENSCGALPLGDALSAAKRSRKAGEREAYEYG